MHSQSRAKVAVFAFPVLFLMIPVAVANATLVRGGGAGAPESGATVLFAEGLERAFLYLRKDMPLPDDGTWPVCTGTAPAHVVSWACIREEGGRLYCFELAFDAALESGQALDVSLAMGDETIAHWSGRAHSVFHAGRSHYDYLLRVTRIDFASDGIRLGLYNEADRRKLPIRLESVSVNGIDATASATFPENPLPADRHRYEEDERSLFLPVAYVDSFPARIDIQFSVKDDGAADEQAWDANRGRLALLVDEGCPHPVGVAPSPVLNDCICLHHGGLRDLPALDTLTERAATAERSCPGRARYVKFSGTPPHDYWVSCGHYCDFAVLSFRTDILDHGRVLEQLMADTRRLVRATCGPTVFSIHPRRSLPSGLDSATLAWLTLCALSAGSRGALFYLSDLHEIRDAQAVLDTLERITQDIGAAAPLIRIAFPVALDVRASAAGLDAQAFVCGPDRLLMFVLNMHTTERLPTRFYRGPFWAATHEDVTLRFAERPFGQATQAFDLSTGERLSIEGDAADMTLALGNIGMGKVIVIENREDDAHQRSTPGRLSFLDSYEHGPDDVLFANGHFMDFGLTEPGERRPLQLEARNHGEAPRVARLQIATSGGASGYLSSAVELTVPAKGAATWKGTWTAPRVYNESLTEIELVDASSKEVFDRCFITAEIAPLFQPDIPHVDFGVVLDIPLRTVALRQREDVEHARITAVACDETPIEYEVDETGNRLSFRPLLEVPGKFHGQLRIAVRRNENETTHELTLPFSGELSAPWRSHPASVVVFLSDALTTYTVHVSRHDNTPFSVVSASSDASWMRAEWENDAQTLHELRLTIERPPAETDETLLSVVCVADDGDEATVVIPVRVLVRDGAGGTGAAENAQAVETLLDRVEGVVATARAIALTPENSAWVKFHALLLYEHAPTALLQDALALVGMGDDAYEYPAAPGFDDVATPFTLRRGKPFPRQKVQRPFLLEDHWDQYLHILSITGVSPSTQLHVGDENHSVADLIALSREEATVHRELPWTISAHAHYTGFTEHWQNKYGQMVNLFMLVERMLDDAPNPTCFETHHLQTLARIREYSDGLSHAEHAQTLVGIQEEIDSAIEIIRDSQMNNGALRPPAYDDQASRTSAPTEYEIFITGHTFEFLSRALPDDMLTDPWILRSVGLLVQLLSRYPVGYGEDLVREQDLWNFGCFCHAVSGLAHWRLRVLRIADPKQ